MNPHKIKLRIDKGMPIAPQRVVMRQGEVGTEQIEAQILEGNVEYTSPLSNVRLDIMHADGTWARVEATKSGSKVAVTLPSEALSVAGVCRLAHFVFYTGTTKVESTEGFELRILPAVDMTAEHAQAYENKLDKLYKKWEAYEKQAEKNESARVSAESDRRSSEDARRSSEMERDRAEVKRVESEASRKSAESSRVSAESARAAAEKKRVVAEASREAAETGREAAEASREAAETSRVNEFASVRDVWSSAVQAADGAALAANLAAGRIECLIRSGAVEESNTMTALDVLSRSSCADGMYVAGTWYVKSGSVSYEDDRLMVRGAKPKGGRMLLPSDRCAADAALAVANRAEGAAGAANRENSVQAAVISALLDRVAELGAMVATLATKAARYPFPLGGTLYVRGVSVRGSRLLVNGATESGGRMLLPAM